MTSFADLVDIAEEIYDYFTNSVQAAQANPQIAIDLGIDINSAIKQLVKA
jgi:hypothetical protein